MKNRDFLYLALLNSKRHIGSVLRTTFALITSLTFSTLLLFFVFAFYFGTLSNLDNSMEFNHLSFPISKWSNGIYSDIYLDDEFLSNVDGVNYITYSNSRKFNSIEKEKIDENPLLEERLIDVEINGNKYPYYEKLEGTLLSSKMDINFLNSYSNEYNNKDFLIAGREIKDTNEIMLSKYFLRNIGVTNYGDILNKNITVYERKSNIIKDYTLCEINNSNKTEINKAICICNMTIVGIYNEFYRTNKMGFGQINVVKKYGPYGKDFIVDSNSVKKIESYNISDKEIVFDKNESSFYDIKYEESSNSDYSTVVDMYFDNFNHSSKFYKYMLNEFGNIHYSVADRIKTADFYTQYMQFHNTITSITIFLGIISFVVFIIALLNVFEIMGYIAIKKKQNIGMMKILGLKNKDIMKLVLSEFSIIMVISSIISFMISFLVSLIFTLTTNKSFRYESLDYDIGAYINFGYYFLAFASVFIVISSLAFISSYILTRKLVKEQGIRLIK